MSVFRTGLIVGAIGILFIIGGFVVYSIEFGTYQRPLDIQPPPGATYEGEENLDNIIRRVYYQTTAQTPDEVAAYYEVQLREHYGNDPDEQLNCVRTPGVGEFPNYREGNGVIPYEYRCLFERSTFNASHLTEVTIQPGVRNDEAGFDYVGTTRIEYFQTWQP